MNKKGVPYVLLLSDPNTAVSSGEHLESFAPDGIHPSSKGYRCWYYHMWKVMTENHFHFPDRDPVTGQRLRKGVESTQKT